MFKFISMLIYIIDLLTILFMTFREKRPANSIIAWTLIFMLFPAAGLIAFALIGRKINQSKIYHLKQEDLTLYNHYLTQLGHTNFKGQYDETSNELIKALQNLTYAPYKAHNEIELFTDGKVLFEDIIKSLQQAKKCINIQFYIFKKDEIGFRILKVLEAKAKEGVEVRFLFDSVGSKTLTRYRLKDFMAAGGKIGEFFPSKIKLININMNHRNHRKVIIIDDCLGYVGGFNVGDEYLGKNPKFGYWRDTHIKFKGPAVQDLNLRFWADWTYATKEKVNFEKAIAALLLTHKKVGEDGMQIVSSGPNEQDLAEIKLGYLKMIQTATRYIYIQSPYLILDPSIMDSLILAAASGVEIKIMIPGKGDHPFVYWANLSYAGKLLKHGVEIYHYDPKAFLHAKTVVIDDEICSIGTANMDTRSFELNFEVNAFIHSPRIAQLQRAAFENDMTRSKQLTLETYEARNTMVRFKEGFSQLFSSLL